MTRQMKIKPRLRNYMTLFCLVVPLIVISQKQGNIWYFGTNAGLDFNSGSPTPLIDGQTAATTYCPIEGTSVISDSSGALLFYSDGQRVWDRNHAIMPNGSGLLGNNSSTQSVLIVPKPDSSRYFYVFTTDDFCYDNLSNGLRYSVVDICLNNGYGDIIPNQKNIKLLDTVCEKLAAVRHANGIDYWILVHKFFSNEFYAYLLTSNGIVDTVISAIGSVHTGSTLHAIGQLKFSSDGQKIAIGSLNGFDLLEVFDFDKSTGIITNCFQPIKPNNNHACVYGVEFSSDNTKLYVHGNFSLGPNIPYLAQYDLSAGGGNTDSVNASLKIIHEDTIPPVICAARGLQIGPDGKIYLGSNKNQSKLAVIQNPNIYGFGCNFQDTVISLLGKIVTHTLPSFIAGYNYSNTTFNCIVEGIKENAKDEIIMYLIL
jgi:hypothetical protein